MRRACLSLILMLVAGGCSSVEIEKTLRLTDVHTGWYDAGIVEGKNKLVPSVSFKIVNTATDPVANVQINAVFHRVGEQEAWGDHYVLAVGQNGLAGGATSASIVLRSSLGYTGTEPRLVILKNSQFVDARVELFGKQGRRNWVKLGEYQIVRELLTR